LWLAFTPAVAPAGAASAGVQPATPRIATGLQRCAEAVPKKAKVAWAQFLATIAQLESIEVRDKPGRMIELVVDAGYEDHLKELFANHRSRLEELEQVAVFARQFASTGDFLAQLALLTNLEAEGDRPAASDDERIRLSTIHQAKGLEFDVVFVIMLCEGLFPSSRSLERAESLEEERRLFYVAITRAKHELYLSYPLARATAGAGDYLQRPSRFLGEIPPDLVEEWNLHTAGC
jgi:DNA helicase-2/ATP-dependent DNA helicase PcrA